MKTNQQKKALWLALRDYKFDNLVAPSLMEKIGSMFGGTDASTKAFAHKLCRKLNWNEDFALKAINEYKKFIYLGCVSDFVVTPSKRIDQVWHEHMLFTQAYREFCANVLGQNFDHFPELVPMDEQTGIFTAQYLDTLALYKDEFNMEAPDGVWGKPKFDPNNLTKADGKYVSRKKRTDNATDTSSSDDTLMLYMLFSGDNSGGVDTIHHTALPEFGGGDFGGGGASGSWANDANTPIGSHHAESTSDTTNVNTTDTGGHTGGESSGETGGDGGSGGGDGGGGGCSGGGGCGGGCGGS